MWRLNCSVAEPAARLEGSISPDGEGREGGREGEREKMSFYLGVYQAFHRVSCD